MALARFQKQEVEPLSPRSANIPPKPKATKTTEAKEMLEEDAKRVEAAKKAAKEKEYASVPPEWVFQPALSKDGQTEKYKTGRLLGKGGFAMAYEGEFRNRSSSHDRKIVALKVVRAKMSQRKMEDKFRTELQIHAKMRHPNIVEFHRAFTYRESTYVVLEMCPNGSVMDMVKKRRCLTLPEVRRLMIQLCGAIKYMHTRNVIHRDLKMGNLFLDHDMNLKIGDFGLAAVLVSKDELEGMCDYAKSRRTTLCGTPNYIAPEILEKGKGGHDYKVDIWAIGVILFAMIAGQPPFQSSSQNEIYKRARNVDYTWPEENKCHNDIPDEAKDLVSRLLKVDAEKRPDPDLIVGHSFFSMHGGDAIPARMEEHFRVEKPHYLDQKARPRGDVMIKGTERLSILSLAKQCGVGYLPGCIAPQPTVGADTDLSLYKECAAEEAAGLGPVVPLPKEMVYVSKYSFDAPALTKQSKADGEYKILTETNSAKRPERSEMLPPRAKFETARRAPVQSHAATLRAAPFTSKVGLSRLDPQLLDIDNIKATQKAETIGVGRSRRGLLNELPVRPSANLVGPTEEADKADQKPRTTRSRKPAVPKEVAASAQKEDAQSKRAVTKDEYIEATSPNPDRKRRQLAARTRARIASNVQKEFEDELDKPVQAPPKAPAKKEMHPQYLLGPDEIVENLPSSRPDAVLEGLRTLRNNLTASLQAANRPPEFFDRQAIEAGKRSNKQRPVLVKWVDYTNKFGISYILADGTVGCLFKGEGNTLNPTCIVVPEAETHLKKRKQNASYRERDQIVSRKGEAVQFIEDCGDEGLLRVCIPPSTFQVKSGEKLGPGKDTWEFEKRRKLCLWDKFGKYMTQSLAPPTVDPDDLDDELSMSNEQMSSKQKAVDNGIFIKFYQRLDNVGIWGFGSGGLQFNFPDHTKLYIDAQGLWADFYHLPLPAARALKSGQHPLDPSDLADRSVLCLPIDVLLRGQYTGQDDAAVRVGKEVLQGGDVEAYVRDVVQANEFEKKARFVARVVGVWVKEGGLGNMGRRKGWRWEGMADKRSVKRVWDSVGARGGDERYEMPNLSS